MGLPRSRRLKTYFRKADLQRDLDYPFRGIEDEIDAAGLLKCGTVALLAAAETGLFSAGQRAYVATVDGYFRWYPGSLHAGLPTGPTRAVASTDGNGFWIREIQPSLMWCSQSTWYVDPIGGNDENDGSLLSTALQSLTEWYLRTNGYLVSNMTINVQNDLLASDRPIWFVQSARPSSTAAGLTIVGAQAFLSTGTITTFTAGNPGANGKSTVLLVGGPTLTPGSFAKIVVYVGAGPAVRCFGYLLAQSGSTYDVGSWSDGNGNEVFPVNGDTFQVVAPLPNILRNISHAQNVLVSYQNVAHTALLGENNTSTDIHTGCIIQGGDIGNGATFNGCIFTGNVSTINGFYSFGQNTFFNASLTNFGCFYQGHGFTFYGGNGFFSYGGGGSFTDLSGNNAFFFTTNGAQGAFFVAQGSIVQLFSGSSLYGSGNAGYGLAIDVRSGFEPDSGTTLKLTGSLGDFSIAGKTTLPTFSGGLPTGTAACTTWAQLAAAPFNGRAMDLETGASITAPAF